MSVFVASFSSPSRWCSLLKGSTSSSKSSSSSSGRRNERGATIQKRGGAGTSASSLSSENHSRGKPNKSEPYKFMGRTVKEKHVFDSQMANELALEVVSEETGVEKEELKKTLQNLQSLLPELSSSSLSSNADAYRASLDIKLVARNAIQIKSVFRELRSNVSEMIAKDLRLALDPRASERCEKALEVLTGRGEMTREEAENLVFATHRYCADKKKMLAFCEEETVLEVCENVRRIRSAVGGEAFLAHKVCEKGDAAANMLFESEKNEAACNAAKALVERMPKDCNVALMVSDFPNLLLMDIDRLFFDLTNAFKSTPPEETLRRDPSVSFRVRSFNNSYEDDGFSEDDRI